MAARIFVFGSYFADMVMATPRLPRRGETIAGGPFRTSHGGKGSNQAVAARRAGAEVVFATRLGDDDAGRANRMAALQEAKKLIDGIPPGDRNIYVIRTTSKWIDEELAAPGRK